MTFNFHPPYGITRAPVSAAKRSTLRTSSRVAGRATPSGNVPTRPLRNAIQSGRLCPRAWRTRSSGSRDMSGCGGNRDGGTAETTSPKRASRGGRPAPTRCARNRAADGGTGKVAASSPQPFHRLINPLPPACDSARGSTRATTVPEGAPANSRRTRRVQCSAALSSCAARSTAAAIRRIAVVTRAASACASAGWCCSTASRMPGIVFTPYPV